MAERYTSQAKEAIKYAEMAAKELSQNYVGTEHLLLGLVQEGSGVAAKILEKNGITEEKILNLIDQLIVSNYNVAILFTACNRCITKCIQRSHKI